MADIQHKKIKRRRSGQEKAPNTPKAPEAKAPDAPDYDALLLLERLESLLEEMEELEVSSRTEIEAKIAVLHQTLDAEDAC